MRILGRLLLVSLLAGACLAVTTIVLAPSARGFFGAGRTSSSEVDLDPLAQNSTVFAADGQLLAVLHAEENRSPVTLEQVPEDVVDAILAVEDEDFYKHGGVNLRATARALLENVSAGEIRQGGSTVTQQVVKNSILTPKKDVNRKLREAVLAMRLEDQMDKDEILERYLNTVYLGNGAYGLQAAAEIYFGKDVEQLDLAEAALLAGMISNPSNYDPFRFPEEAEDRRGVAIDRLVKVGEIDADEATALKRRPIPTDPARVLPKPDDYFVEEVKQQLLDNELLGESATDRYNAVFKGGLRIETTLDRRAQFFAITARNEVLGGIPDIALGRTDGENECTPRTGALQAEGEERCFTAALASLDPRSGAVRAMVGGPGFEKYKYNLATQGVRQTGSAFKGFVLMAALETGFVPDDGLSGSSPCRFPNPGGVPDPYEASNFGESRGGEGTITQQTLRSSNCAYLRLGQAVGLDKVVVTAKRMGVTSPLEPVLSLPLGVKEVSPLEMASSYGTIATGGIRHEPYYIERIRDRDGRVLFEHQGVPERVLGQQTTCLATQILERNVQSGTGTRARLRDQRAAGKTGTAQRFDDAWFVGFTPQLATAVWMGAPEKKIPMTSVGGIRVTGGSYPATIWGRYMGAVLDEEEPVPFPECARTRRGERVKLAGDLAEEERRRRAAAARATSSTATTTSDEKPSTTKKPPATSTTKAKPPPTTKKPPGPPSTTP